jgi:hypothetical protein
MMSRGSSVRVLHSVVARDQNQIPGNGHHESANHKARNAHIAAQHFDSKLRNKLDFWEGISRGQENPGQLTTKPVASNVETNSKPVLIHINGDINNPTSQPRQRSQNEGRDIAAKIRLFQSGVEPLTTKRAKVKNYSSKQ